MVIKRMEGSDFSGLCSAAALFSVLSPQLNSNPRQSSTKNVWDTEFFITPPLAMITDQKDKAHSKNVASRMEHHYSATIACDD